MNKLYVNNLCIGLLNNCNWNCKYCIARNNKLVINEDEIIEQIIPIKYKLNTLYLSGGEPGILSTNFWDRLFSLTDYKLKICSNGTFIINGLADRYKSKIKHLVIHCVEEIDQDINPIVLNFIKHSDIQININFVVHRLNTNLIRLFLKKYNQIGFMINFTDETFTGQSDTGYKYNIDRNAAIEIIKQLSGIPRYSQYTTILTKSVIENNFKYLNGWSPENKVLDYI